MADENKSEEVKQVKGYSPGEIYLPALAGGAVGLATVLVAAPAAVTVGAAVLTAIVAQKVEHVIENLLPPPDKE